MIDILQDYWLIFLIGQYPNGPLGGLALTLILAFLGLVLSFPLAMGLALAYISPVRPLAFIARQFINFIRGTPLLMIIFWAYFAIPMFTGGSISGFWTLTTALVFYESAYLAEIIRSGIEAIPKGQIEAARSLGSPYGLTMLKVVLPQALFNVIPSLTSQFVSTIKETSLGYVISVHELTFSANQVNNLVLTKPLQVFGILAVTYFVFCFSLSRCMARLDVNIRRKRAMIR